MWVLDALASEVGGGAPQDVRALSAERVVKYHHDQRLVESQTTYTVAMWKIK